MASGSTVHGRCNCGLITVSVPTASFAKGSYLCHCLKCRASSGSLFSVNLPTPIADVSIEGTANVYHDTRSSGKSVARHFCGNCGSAIMSLLETMPYTAFLKGGLFKSNGVDLPGPVQQQWTRMCEKWKTLIPDIITVE